MPGEKRAADPFIGLIAAPESKAHVLVSFHADGSVSVRSWHAGRIDSAGASPDLAGARRILEQALAEAQQCGASSVSR